MIRSSFMEKWLKPCSNSIFKNHNIPYHQVLSKNIFDSRGKRQEECWLAWPMKYGKNYITDHLLHNCESLAFRWLTKSVFSAFSLLYAFSVVYKSLQTHLNLSVSEANGKWYIFRSKTKSMLTPYFPSTWHLRWITWIKYYTYWAEPLSDNIIWKAVEAFYLV